MGQALGEECIALKVDVLLGPGTNMKRTPVGGRNFEYFSEDPYLAGRNGGQLHQRRAEQGRGHFAQALCRQQPGISSASRINAESR